MRKAFFLMLFVLTGCLPAAGGTVVTPTVKPYPGLSEPVLPVEIPSTVPELTLDELANGEYTTQTLPDSAQTYRLTNGLYQSGADPASKGYISVVMLDNVAFGDLNGDGLDDAVIVLSENYGGTGMFVSLVAVLNQAGEPQQAAVLAVDDRPNIETLGIVDGSIVLGAVIHSFEDPGCCPTFSVMRTYSLSGSELMLVRQTSRTPAGQVRAISILSPWPGAEISGLIELQGAVTIAPFENNLVYRLFGPANDLLQEGPVTVSAPEMGAPGTFAVSIPLPPAAPGSRLRVEILDASMADGSTLALDSVFIVVK